MMPNKTKIICYRGDRSACYWYRLQVPMSAVARHNKDKFEVTMASYITEDQIGAYNVAIFQRQYDQKVFDALRKMKKKKTKVIYEIDDDLFNIPEWNPAKKLLGKKAVQDNLKYFLNEVDACFTTNDYLAKLYSEYCKKVYILPNSLDYTKFVEPPKNSAMPVVCWQGSSTHDQDLILIQSAVERLVEEKNCFVKLWSTNLIKAYNVPHVPFEGFYPMLGQLDGKIGLAPLTSVPFNRSKSNLKFLEYAAVGMVTVASNFGPYAETIEHGKTGLLVGDNRDWYDTINSLLVDNSLYNQIRENAMTFVKENFDIEKTYTKWVDAFNQIIG